MWACPHQKEGQIPFWEGSLNMWPEWNVPFFFFFLKPCLLSGQRASQGIKILGDVFKKNKTKYLSLKGLRDTYSNNSVQLLLKASLFHRVIEWSSATALAVLAPAHSLGIWPKENFSDRLCGPLQGDYATQESGMARKTSLRTHCGHLTGTVSSGIPLWVHEDGLWVPASPGIYALMIWGGVSEGRQSLRGGWVETILSDVSFCSSPLALLFTHGFSGLSCFRTSTPIRGGKLHFQSFV